jgi:hypothetical protein
VTRKPVQPDLFPEDARPEDATALVAVNRAAAGLSKAQQTFNRLVASIRRERESLARWQAFDLDHRRRVGAELLPLLAELTARQKEMAGLLDELLSRPQTKEWRLSRSEREALQGTLVDLLRNLLAEQEADPELVAMHDRHSATSMAEQRRAEVAMTEAMLDEMLGEGVLGDHDAQSAEELLAHAGAKLRDAAQRLESGQEEAAPGPRGAQAKRAEEAKAQAAKEASQSVREVYRKLARALHPDRETDAAERARKTQMMQRVNQAYERNDLLALLGLQIEIEQIDTEHLAQVSDARLGHYNRVLKEQLSQLRTEIAACTAPYQATRNAPFGGGKLTVKSVEAQFEREMRSAREVLAELRRDLVAFRDPAGLRARLKEAIARRRQQEREARERQELEAFLRTMLTIPPRPAGSVRPAPPAKRRRRR